MTNLVKRILALSGLMASFASAQLPTSTSGFLSSPFYFYNPQMIPTINSVTDANPTFKQDITYQEYPTSTLLGSHFVFLSTCLKDLKDSNQKLVQTSKLLEEMQLPTSSIIENLKNELNVLKRDVQSSKSDIEDLTTEFTVLAESSAASSIGKIPATCGDLQQIGHKKSGLFSVMGNNSKIETVYCDFTKLSNDPASQKWIGYADVKSLPTFFYAQKTSQFSTLNVPIPFEYERLNIGGAMNVEKGVFTAPRKGVYFFAFSGIALITGADGAMDVALMVNGDQVGLAKGHSKTENTSYEWETYTLQSTIDLNAGDQVWLQIVVMYSAILQDDSRHFTHFTGWMLQEDISP